MGNTGRDLMPTNMWTALVSGNCLLEMLVWRGKSPSKLETGEEECSVIQKERFAKHFAVSVKEKKSFLLIIIIIKKRCWVICSH